MKWNRVTCAVSLSIALAAVSSGVGGGVIDETNGDPPGYERLQPGSAWCAPRALYFLARYCGEECSLESAVTACQSDAEGRTTLAGLVRAAESLRLDPRPIHCTAGDLARVSGPAIISLGEPDADVHFVGLVRRDEQGRARIIDPSMGVSPFWVANEKLADRFAGYIVVLRGSTQPGNTWHWLAPVLSAIVVGLGLLLVFSGRRFVLKRGART